MPLKEKLAAAEHKRPIINIKQIFKDFSSNRFETVSAEKKAKLAKQKEEIRKHIQDSGIEALLKEAVKLKSASLTQRLYYYIPDGMVNPSTSSDGETYNNDYGRSQLLWMAKKADVAYQKFELSWADSSDSTYSVEIYVNRNGNINFGSFPVPKIIWLKNHDVLEDTLVNAMAHATKHRPTPPPDFY